MAKINKVFFVVAFFIVLTFSISINSFALSSQDITKFEDKHISYIKNLAEYQQYECYLVKYFISNRLYEHRYLFLQ